MSKVKGFSKLNKNQKINWLIENYFTENQEVKNSLQQYWNTDEKLQELHDGFVENPISNFYLPYAVSPNFLINKKIYALPMVIEESSVVAASSKAAKYWMDKGGFTTQVLGHIKPGHVHFLFSGHKKNLFKFFKTVKEEICQRIAPLQENMRARGGGVVSMELIDKTDELENYFQIEVKFDTVESMGANFINTILEEIANIFRELMPETLKKETEIIMSILSNFTPECVVRSEVSCKIEDLKTKHLTGQEYAQKFLTAIKIAENEPYRAVTHNKGIMNGIDAVVLATGNDFRAVEAGAHAYAAREGKYTSLSHAEIKGDLFRFWIDIPLAVGTVGGLTGLHPLVKFSLQLLNSPSAKDLMGIMASAGLAQNFAAINALITEGIQQGHMKMHLNNLLQLLGANKEQSEKARLFFNNRKVSIKALKDFLNQA